jgi:hypothetical protein
LVTSSATSHVAKALERRSLLSPRGTWDVVFTIAVCAAAIALAKLLLATRLSRYGDEGYMLSSLANYLKLGHLYF